MSFSIKTKEELAIPNKPCLPQEPSSGEDEEELKAKIEETPKPKTPSPPPRSKTPIEIQNDKIDLVTEMVSGEFSGSRPIGWSTSTSTPVILAPIPVPPPCTIDFNSTEADRREREARRAAEEKLKDRLAAAAREKLGFLSKEKQLQLERKKRAMAFLNQIKGF